MNRRAFLAALPALALPDMRAPVVQAEIRVGGMRVDTMQEAADAGGTILVSAGALGTDALGRARGPAHFRKPVHVIGRNTVVAGASIEDKGTFIVDVDATFDGFDVSGSTGDGIGAAFRHQGGDLLIRRTRIHQCENGLLGPARFVDCHLVIDECDVYENGTGTGQTHGLYVGEIRSFTCLRSRFRATSIGHHIKSRALRTKVRHCEVGADFLGNESYNVDVPQAGHVEIDGCTMRQGPKTDNDAMVNYGGERHPHAGRSFVVSNTTFESLARGTAIRIHRNADVLARIENCRFAGVDVPVEGRCVMRGCTLDGRRLPDGEHHRRMR
jgi:hypothetical protein